MTSLVVLPTADAQVGGGVATRDSVIKPTPFERELIGADRPAIPALANYRVFESERGWVFTQDSVRAREIIAAVRWAAARFEQIFGKPACQSVVVNTVGEGPPLNVREVFPEACAYWSLVASPGSIGSSGETDSVALFASRPEWEAKTREELRQQRPSLTAAQLNDTLAQLWAARVRYLLHDFTGTLTHELGHGWFRNAYPNLDAGATGYRAWLVEGVGVLMEGPKSGRLKNLVDFYKEPRHFVSLDTLFTMPYPVFDPLPDYPGGYVYEFYTQLAGVNQFFLERTHDLTVFGSIAASYAGGIDMPDWLRTNGPRYGLPPTIEELDRAWKQWLAEFAGRGELPQRAGEP